MTRLTAANLGRLDPAVARPGYDRSLVTPGIVHLSVGGFHRSHEAMYVDALMNRGQAMDWGIVGIGLLPSNHRMRDVLRAQDHLYTLVAKHNDGTWEPRVIGSIIDYRYAPDDPEAVIAAMADPRIRIVSMTVTEGGYNVDPITGRFAAEQADVVADLQPGAVPQTMFGLVVEALARRRAAGNPAFSILSCDNIQGNGHVAHRVFTEFARLRDPDLAAWIDESVRFPNSMVDRITPQTSDGDRLEVARRFGVEDDWPVLCEPFCQWVLEDDFGAGRPPLEDVGVQVVADVAPYELMKLRLLNASHQALCYPGYLVGYRYAHEVTSDPLFAQFLRDYMTREAIPTLQPVPGIDLHDYVEELIERFSNPEVADTLERLCANTSDLIPKFILPVILEQLAVGGEITRAVAVVASWARYADEVDEAGGRYELDDARAEQLRAAAAGQDEDPLSFVTGNRQLFGDLVDDARFTRVYLALVRSVRQHGIRRTFADLDAAAGSTERHLLMTMRRAVVYPDRVAIELVDRPAPLAGEVLVRSLFAGVCGSDVHAAHGRHPFVPPPYFPGHEVVGVVEALGPDGEGTATGSFAVGQRVVLEPFLPCWQCKMCRTGRQNLCERLRFFGCGYDQGAMADYFTVPADRLHGVPDGLDDHAAALIEPLATPVHAVGLAGDVEGKTVVVLGAGTIGLLLLSVLQTRRPAQVVVTDPHADKRERALRLGATAAFDPTEPELVARVRTELGESADIVFDCVGVASSVEQSIALADKGGTVVVVGVPASPVTIPLPIIQDHQIRIQGSATYLPADFAESIGLLESGAVRAGDFVTAVRPLDAAAEAFELAASGDHIKVLISIA